MDDLYDPVAEMNEAAIIEEDEYHRANKEEADDYRNEGCDEEYEDTAPLGFYLETNTSRQICTRIEVRDMTLPPDGRAQIASYTIIAPYNVRTEMLITEAVQIALEEYNAPVALVEEHNLLHGWTWKTYFTKDSKKPVVLHLFR